MKRTCFAFLGALCLSCLSVGPSTVRAGDFYTDPPAPLIGPGNVTNGQERWSLPAYPSADSFLMWRQETVGSPWVVDESGSFSNLTWTAPAPGAQRFHR